MKRISSLALLLALACSKTESIADSAVLTDAGVGDAAVLDSAVTEAPLPASPQAYEAWLRTEMYKTWHCDRGVQAPVGNSPHGDNIICVNSVLNAARSGASDTQFPVGSAAVKITFDSAGNEGARFLDVRTSDAADEAGWYFLVAMPNNMAAQGQGGEAAVRGCVGCHSGASRDFVARIPAM